MKKIVSFCLGLTIACSAGLGLASCTKKDNGPSDVNLENYNRAISLLESKDYAGAQALFEQLGDYKDAEEYLSNFYYMPISFEYDLIGKNGTNVITYHENNLPASEIIDRVDAQGVFDFVYDEKGNITQQVLTRDGVVSVYKYTYNEAGKRLKAEYTIQGEWFATHTFEYDADGNVSRQVYTDAQGTTYEYLLEHDSHGNITRLETIYNGESQVMNIRYTYAENQSLLEEVCTYPDGTFETVQYVYDENNRRVKQIITDTDGEQTWYDFTYDEHRNIVKEVFTDEEGNQQYVKIVYELKYIPCGITEGTELFFREIWVERL